MNVYRTKGVLFQDPPDPWYVKARAAIRPVSYAMLDFCAFVLKALILLVAIPFIVIAFLIKVVVIIVIVFLAVLSGHHVEFNVKY